MSRISITTGSGGRQTNSSASGSQIERNAEGYSQGYLRDTH